MVLTKRDIPPRMARVWDKHEGVEEVGVMNGVADVRLTIERRSAVTFIFDDVFVVGLLFKTVNLIS
jgi:hypothetical protein